MIYIESNELGNYRLKILYEVEVAKWRIDDQSLPENQEWRLHVYDRNQGKWVQVSGLSDTEYAKIKLLQIEEDE